MDRVRIYIGYDPKEAAAYHVCCQSIIAHSSMPVEFIPLHALPISQKDGSNAFTYARFLVPYLNGFKGHAIYLDGDMTVKGDIAELWAMRRVYTGAQVVQHSYKTKHPVKYFGAKNEDYPRKNWSSVILWNCGFLPNAKLTPEFVEAQTGAFLHRFQWLEEERIGPLPKEWNWLEGEYPANPHAKLIHHTLGTPCIQGYENSDHADDWYRELGGALNVQGQAPTILLERIK